MRLFDFLKNLLSKNNENYVDENKKNFYEKYFSAEAKKFSSNKEWILNYCIRKAWADAIASERFNKGSEIVKSRESIISFMENELLNNPKNICDNFNEWHNCICQRKEFNMRYGVWQKLVNMTFKYLYCIEETFPEFNCIWEECHCPIDTVISKQIHIKLTQMGFEQSELMLSYKVANSDSTVNWNNITKNDYLKLQNQIKYICEKENIYPIEFDFLYWKN